MKKTKNKQELTCCIVGCLATIDMAREVVGAAVPLTMGESWVLI